MKDVPGNSSVKKPEGIFKIKPGTAKAMGKNFKMPIEDGINEVDVETKMNKVLSSNNIITKVPWYDKINRFGFINLNDTFTGAKEYTFFTKPDLNLYKDASGKSLNPDVERNPVIMLAHKRDSRILHQLQSSVTSNKSPFMYLVSNSLKNTIDLPGITSKEIETSANMLGTKIFYRKHSFESSENHDFTTELEDTQDLSVYLLFRCWDEYINMKSLGLVSPTDDYRLRRIIHDQVSTYKIIVHDDFETILFFAKITGCYPKSVPREFFSEVGEKLIYNISWKGQFVRDMDPMLLQEFNALTIGKGGNTIPLYDKNNSAVNGEWANVPYIVSNGNGVYKLKWR